MSERTIRGDDDVRTGHRVRTGVVAVITAGSSGCGREIARALPVWDWALVIVYLEDQSKAEVTVAEIHAAQGNVVAVRADLADELDVQRLFKESAAAFSGVDVIVHTAPGPASLLYRYAERHVRSRGAIVSVPGAEPVPPTIAPRLGERGIGVGRAPPEEVLSFLDSWRRPAPG